MMFGGETRSVSDVVFLIGVVSVVMATVPMPLAEGIVDTDQTDSRNTDVPEASIPNDRSLDPE